MRRRCLRRMHGAARWKDDQLLHRAGGQRRRTRGHDRRGPRGRRATPPRAAGLHRRGRLPVRHLYARPGGVGQGAARRDPESQRCRDPRLDARQSLSLHRLLQDHRIDPNGGPAEPSMSAFEYVAPRTLDEALAVLRAQGDEARVIAGGTALVTMMRQRLVRPSYLVSLREVSGLGRIEAENGDLRIGALVTHREVETSSLVRERFPVLAETFRRVASVRIRNMATVGGALAHADPNQDPPVTLIALRARVEIRGAAGGREVPVEDFFRDYYESVLEPGEIVTGVVVPRLPAASGAAYVKFLPRTADDYATVAVAATVSLEPDGERCRAARLALGSVGVTPIRARAAEALVAGQRLDAALLHAAGEAVKAAVDPLSDHRGSAAYKREMAAVMVGRAFTQAWNAALESARPTR